MGINVYGCFCNGGGSFVKDVYLLGATGSIGMQVLDIIRANPNQFRLVSATTNKRVDLLRKIIREFQPQFVSVGSKEDRDALKKEFDNLLVGYGKKGLVQSATFGEKGKGIVLNAIVGSAGLEVTIASIKHRRDVALANKESLVIGGELITPLLKEYGVRLLPVDSEHSAIFQCLVGEEPKTVKKIIITASGGSFRDKSRGDLRKVTIKDALNHPNWHMGAKITIDSATMMNKGLEVIEAHHLFDIPYDQISTVLHRESIVHSLVEFHDGSMLAHLGMPDMRVPISYALNYPNRAFYNAKRLDLETLGTLHFEKLSFERYPMLKYAYEAGKKGGYAPTVLNAANEAAVHLFLNGSISFLQIEQIVLQCSKQFHIKKPLSLAGILEVDDMVKQYVFSAYMTRK
jgi:1-deoxy-D-xylulose-5-phosphate reductoisomerase